MNNYDAARLKPGDIVEVKVGKKLIQATVCEPETWSGRQSVGSVAFKWCENGGVYLRLRRIGQTRAKHPYARFQRPAVDATFITRPVRGTGHIYADYLEECGYSEAAAILRKAFPITPDQTEL
jgi:hypothetical protein